MIGFASISRKSVPFAHKVTWRKPVTRPSPGRAPLGRDDGYYRSCYSSRMIPWEKIDTARIPGTDGELRLMRRGAEFSIMLGTNELMNSRLSGSEAALATLAAKKIEKVAKPHMLIGGLGMGFTLRAALGALGAKAQIVVAELVPAVVAWARGPMAEIFGDSPNDPRVSIRETDVAEIIRSHRGAFDAILLD